MLPAVAVLVWSSILLPCACAGRLGQDFALLSLPLLARCGRSHRCPFPLERALRRPLESMTRTHVTTRPPLDLFNTAVAALAATVTGATI